MCQEVVPGIAPLSRGDYWQNPFKNNKMSLVEQSEAEVLATMGQSRLEITLKSTLTERCKAKGPVAMSQNGFKIN